MSQASGGIRFRILRRRRGVPAAGVPAAGVPAAGGGRRRRVLLAFAALLAVAVLAVAHVAWWYLPRTRTARPKAGYLPARLLANEELPFAVWMPYPHQNLAVLEGATAEDRASTDLTAAMARLAGVPEPSLPAFGSFRVPPSREITFASGEDGERFAVAAEVYPSVAAFAKLAGRLAGNPWLSGGELTVEGRRVVVEWRGRVWTVASPGMPELGTDAERPQDPPSLLAIEARRLDPPFPAGRYFLELEGGDLVLASAGAPAREPAFEPAIDEMGLFLLVVSGGDAALAEPMQAMAFFGRDEPLELSREGVSYELPGMASIWETGQGRQWKMPGESLLKWSGRKPRQATLGRFTAAAMDGRSFRRIQKLAPDLAPLVSPGPRGSRLRWGLWLDLEASQLEISRIARALQEIPIGSRRSKRRWRDAATVLEPAARRYSRLSVVVTEEPRALRLRFSARAGEDAE